MSNYKPTIGIEVHLELNTDAKVFSLSKNNYSDVAVREKACKATGRTWSNNSCTE